jgi:hypothetical protein
MRGASKGGREGLAHEAPGTHSKARSLNGLRNSLRIARSRTRPCSTSCILSRLSIRRYSRLHCTASQTGFGRSNCCPAHSSNSGLPRVRMCTRAGIAWSHNPDHRRSIHTGLRPHSTSLPVSILLEEARRRTPAEALCQAPTHQAPKNAYPGHRSPPGCSMTRIYTLHRRRPCCQDSRTMLCTRCSAPLETSNMGRRPIRRPSLTRSADRQRLDRKTQIRRCNKACGIPAVSGFGCSVPTRGSPHLQHTQSIGRFRPQLRLAEG